MALHPVKTKFMLLASRQKRQNIEQLPPLFISNHPVEIVNSHKVLGLTIDCNLSWSNHSSILCNSLAKKVYQFNKIKHFLDINARKLFFYAYIQSSIDYCSSLWDSASENALKFVFSLHRRAIKIVMLKSSSLTASDYKQLNILPLKFRFMFNKAVLMFKILSGAAPHSLTSKFEVNNARHSHKIVVPRPRIDLYKSSLHYSGGMLWNNLPNTLKNISSLQVFIRSLHKYLMTCNV